MWSGLSEKAAERALKGMSKLPGDTVNVPRPKRVVFNTCYTFHGFSVARVRSSDSPWDPVFPIVALTFLWSL